MGSTKILGISAFYHDSAIALIDNGEICFALQEERLSRKKHDPSFPNKAIEKCLQSQKISINDLDAVVFYEKPFLKFERLLETYYAFAPKGVKQFTMSIPVWIKEKLFLKKLIIDELYKIEKFDKKKLNLLFSEHHLSHAASAFYPSPFNEAAIITIDGVGEWTTASIGYGEDNIIKILKEQKFPHSVGLLYSSFTYYTGFKVNSGEYKLMGLAPYGDPNSKQFNQFKEIIKTHLVDIKDDGSIWLNQKYFNYAVGLEMVNNKRWKKLFGINKREPESEITQDYCNMALAIQEVIEEIVIKMASKAKKLTNSNNLCLAGGVALNCVANGKLLQKKLFDNIWIQPAAGDAGGALGAAYAIHHICFNQPRQITTNKDKMRGSYLGPEYTNLDVEVMVKKSSAPFEKYEDTDELLIKVAELIDQGYIIGWHQGKEEWGPRALGNRSILGDVRNPEMQKRLNLKIKYRESFRPFAPSAIEEEISTLFEGGYVSPYMLLIDYVNKDRRNPLPNNFNSLPLKEKLYFLRSDMPAITHLDYSARLQTVSKDTNPKYHKLISKFKDKTDYGIIVNTSFNVRGEPIVCSPEDAYLCFMRTEMDFLVINNYLFDKNKQPELREKTDWRASYTLD